MQGGDAQNYPQYEDRHKQEAARFLHSGPENLKPMLRGMINRERLDAWTEVAKDLDVDEAERRLLRQRRVQLNERNSDHPEEEEEFVPATEIEPAPEPAEPAVADGGADVADPEQDDKDEWEPREHQTVVEYDDPADRESQKQDAASVAKYIETADEVREKIAEERDSDRVRPHVIDALEERLEVLEE